MGNSPNGRRVRPSIYLWGRSGKNLINQGNTRKKISYFYSPFNQFNIFIHSWFLEAVSLRDLKYTYFFKLIDDSKAFWAFIKFNHLTRSISIHFFKLKMITTFMVCPIQKKIPFFATFYEINFVVYVCKNNMIINCIIKWKHHCIFFTTHNITIVAIAV